MTLFIDNLSSGNSSLIVRNILADNNITPASIDADRITLHEPLDNYKLSRLRTHLKRQGFPLSEL